MRLFLAAAAAVLSIAAPAGAQSIQPGDAIDGENCTLGWLFDGSGGHAYFATAAHCVEDGATVTVGDDEPLGAVVVRGDDTIAASDVALIRVREELLSRISGELRGHPGMPRTGARAESAVAGETLQFSGYGTGFGFTGPTRERRQGIFTSFADDGTVWRGVSPTSFGDSGGPVAHPRSGGALGLVKGFSCGNSEAGPQCGGWGPTLAGIDEVAAAGGLTLKLRTVGPTLAKPVEPEEQEPEPSSPPKAEEKPAPAEAPAPAPAPAPGAVPCVDTLRPAVALRSVSVRRTGVRLRGTASDTGCGAKVARTEVAVVRGKAAPRFHVAGAERWSLTRRSKLRRGRYTVIVRVTDAAGNRTEVRRAVRVR